MRNVNIARQLSARRLHRVKRSGSALVAGLFAVLAGCTSLIDDDPGALASEIFDPRGAQHATDRRAAFRAFFCATNAAVGASLPDYRSCDTALRRVTPEPAAIVPDTSGGFTPVTLLIVLGLGYDCVTEFIDNEQQLLNMVRQRGHNAEIIEVDGLGSSEANARIIRDRIEALSSEALSGRLLLMGYSKGSNDILSALARYPSLADDVDAVISLSGAVGGSLLAPESSDWALGLTTRLPGSRCSMPEENALHSLYPAVRQTWLAENPLPDNVSYFSLVTLPERNRISSALTPSYRALAKTDARNDGQVLALDQVIPGSEVLAFLNADHWAATLPMERGNPWLAAVGVNENDFPREVLMLALLRYVNVALDQPDR